MSKLTEKKIKEKIAARYEETIQLIDSLVKTENKPLLESFMSLITYKIASLETEMEIVLETLKTLQKQTYIVPKKSNYDC